MQFSTVSSSLGPFPTQKLDFRPRPGARIEDEGLRVKDRVAMIAGKKVIVAMPAYKAERTIEKTL